jgi:general secretion pathway protein M
MKSRLMRLWQPMQSRWQQMGRREQLALKTAATLAGLALVWWVLLAPALHTLRSSEIESLQLDTQLIRMQELQAQVRELKDRPPMSAEAARRALESSVSQRFGQRAQLSPNGNQFTLTLKSVSAEALAQWLTQARINAHSHIVEARLIRTPTGLSQDSWDGTLLVDLPGH